MASHAADRFNQVSTHSHTFLFAKAMWPKCIFISYGITGTGKIKSILKMPVSNEWLNPLLPNENEGSSGDAKKVVN